MKSLLCLPFVLLTLAACGTFAQGSGSSLNFDGTNDYVEVPHNIALNLNTLTLEAWIRTTVSNSTHRILAKPTTTTSGFQRYSMFVANDLVYFVAGGNQTYCVSTSTVTDGEWHHVAGVFDDNTNVLQIYIDGVLETTTSDAAAPLSSTGNLAFGSFNSSYSEHFNGEIDEIRIWNTARSQAQIRDNMTTTLTGSETGLVGCWRFDENTGTTAFDSTPNGHNGTLMQ